MFSDMTFDDLNKMVGTKKSIPYETYFSNTGLSDKQKENRISLAKKMEEKFTYAMILLFTMAQYSKAIDYESVRAIFETGYLAAITGTIDVDDYIESYVKQFSYDIIDSTKKHDSDPYYYSKDRVKLISENESQTSWNYQEYVDAKNSGKTKKKWRDIRDKRERETHRKVGGTVLPIGEPFLVGDSLMYYPKDTSLGASDEEIANCRCSIKYF